MNLKNERRNFGIRSKEISRRISPEICSNSLISILYQ